MESEILKASEKEDSNIIADSDSNEDEEVSHFQFEDDKPSTTGFQMVQWEEGCNNTLMPQGVRQQPNNVAWRNIPGVPFKEVTALHQAFKKRNTEVLFKQNHSKKQDQIRSQQCHIAGQPIDNGFVLQSPACQQCNKGKQEQDVIKEQWRHHDC
jgi:hypothetical protein